MTLNKHNVNGLIEFQSFLDCTIITYFLKYFSRSSRRCPVFCECLLLLNLQFRIEHKVSWWAATVLGSGCAQSGLACAIKSRDTIDGSSHQASQGFFFHRSTAQLRPSVHRHKNQLCDAIGSSLVLFDKVFMSSPSLDWRHSKEKYSWDEIRFKWYLVVVVVVVVVVPG